MKEPTWSSPVLLHGPHTDTGCYPSVLSAFSLPAHWICTLLARDSERRIRDSARVPHDDLLHRSQYYNRVSPHWEWHDVEIVADSRAQNIVAI